MRLGRRSFLAGSAAVCIGCSQSDVSLTQGTTTTQPPTTTSPPTSTTATTATPTTGDNAPSGDVPDPAADVDNPVAGLPVILGSVDEILERIDANDGRAYDPAARAWLVRYPADALDAAADAYDEASLVSMQAGFLVLYQKCPHLGCRVPDCASSGQFECPCHGAFFSSVGEYIAGPSPRGLDRFTVEITDGTVTLGPIAAGLDAGVTTVDTEPDGPSCISAG